jgi:carbon monoxide dehydrogenase subunit G
MLHFEGDKDFSQPLQVVWSKLSDARFLVECIPGAEGITAAEADKAVCKVRPGFAFVRGTLEVTLTVVERVPESSVRLTLFSKGIGSTSDVEAVLRLTPQDQGTRIHWTADVKQLGGLLKAVPKGLIGAAAQKVIADVWSSVENKLPR